MLVGRETTKASRFEARFVEIGQRGTAIPTLKTLRGETTKIHGGETQTKGDFFYGNEN